MLLEAAIQTPLLADSLAEEAKSERQVNRPMFDLFAGCGGLSLGFEHAGFTPIFVNELNDDARSTYLANRSYPLAGNPFNEHSELFLLM